MFSTFEKHFKELNFENYKNQNIQCNIKSIISESHFKLSFKLNCFCIFLVILLLSELNKYRDNIKID